MNCGLFDHGRQILIEHEAVINQGEAGFGHHPEVLRPAPVAFLHRWPGIVTGFAFRASASKRNV